MQAKITRLSQKYGSGRENVLRCAFVFYLLTNQVTREKKTTSEDKLWKNKFQHTILYISSFPLFLHMINRFKTKKKGSNNNNRKTRSGGNSINCFHLHCIWLKGIFISLHQDWAELKFDLEKKNYLQAEHESVTKSNKV